MSTDLFATDEVGLISYCGPARSDNGLRVRYQITRNNGDRQPGEDYVTLSSAEALSIAKAIIKDQKKWAKEKPAAIIKGRIGKSL